MHVSVDILSIPQGEPAKMKTVPMTSQVCVCECVWERLCQCPYGCGCTCVCVRHCAHNLADMHVCKICSYELRVSSWAWVYLWMSLFVCICIHDGKGGGQYHIHDIVSQHIFPRMRMTLSVFLRVSFCVCVRARLCVHVFLTCVNMYTHVFPVLCVCTCVYIVWRQIRNISKDVFG